MKEAKPKPVEMQCYGGPLDGAKYNVTSQFVRFPALSPSNNSSHFTAIGYAVYEAKNGRLEYRPNPTKGK